MTLAFFLKGIVVGFSLAAPVGPIGLLCIRRSLAEGRLVGLATGLGAATADATYAAIAGFGLTAVSAFLVTQKIWLGVIGGAFLCVMGTRTFLAPPADHAARLRGDGSLLSAYGSTFFLTLTNPMTILAFIPLFAGLGLGLSGDYASPAATVAGVFGGSALWWLLLSGGVSLLRAHIKGWMRLVNHVSGAIIIAFGLYAILTALKR